jgi:hypothetical protein
MQSIKKYGVWLGLLITLVLVYVVEQGEGDADTLVTIADKESFTSTPDIKTKPLTAEKSFLLRERIVEAPTNLFSVSSMAQIEQVYDDQPSEPELPINPYRYVGKLVEGEEVIVFLTDGRKNYAVKTGDTLEGTWKVDFIKPPEMGLQFLPLQTHVRLQVGVLL